MNKALKEYLITVFFTFIALLYAVLIGVLSVYLISNNIKNRISVFIGYAVLMLIATIIMYCISKKKLAVYISKLEGISISAITAVILFVIFPFVTNHRVNPFMELVSTVPYFFLFGLNFPETALFIPFVIFEFFPLLSLMIGMITKNR